MNTIRIGQVEIIMGKKVVRMELGEALELRDILNHTFPQKEYELSTRPVYLPILIDQPVYPRYGRWSPSWIDCRGDVAAQTLVVRNTSHGQVS